jgi:hypothetical protein
MKKQYIYPEMQVVEINVPQLLAGSEIPGGGTTNQNLAPRFELDEEGLF